MYDLSWIWLEHCLFLQSSFHGFRKYYASSKRLENSHIQFYIYEPKKKKKKDQHSKIGIKEQKVALTCQWHPVKCLIGVEAHSGGKSFLKLETYLSKRTPFHWFGCKHLQPLWKSIWWFLRKTGTDQSQDPATPLQGTHLKHPSS